MNLSERRTAALALIAVTLFFGPPTRALEASEPSIVAEKVATDVVAVSAGGLWESDGRYGIYRLITVNRGAEHSQSYFFAQWLKFDEASGEHTLVQSVPVNLLNQRLSVVQSVVFDFEASKGKGVFRVEIRDREPDRRRTAVVTLKAIGQADAILLESQLQK